MNNTFTVFFHVVFFKLHSSNGFFTQATCISTAPYVSAHLQRSYLRPGFWLVLADRKRFHFIEEKRQAHGNEEALHRSPKIRPQVAECSMGSALKKSKQLLSKAASCPCASSTSYRPVYLLESTYLSNSQGAFFLQISMFVDAFSFFFVKKIVELVISG